MNQDELFAWVRAIGAMLAIIILLSLMTVSFVRDAAPLAQSTVVRLLILIGALLSIDLGREVFGNG